MRNDEVVNFCVSPFIPFIFCFVTIDLRQQKNKWPKYSSPVHLFLKVMPFLKQIFIGMKSFWNAWPCSVLSRPWTLNDTYFEGDSLVLLKIDLWEKCRVAEEASTKGSKLPGVFWAGLPPLQMLLSDPSLESFLSSKCNCSFMSANMDQKPICSRRFSRYQHALIYS